MASSALLEALMGAQYKAQENPWGIMASGIGAAAPMLVSPYQSVGKNIGYTAGASLLAGILGGLAQDERDRENVRLMDAFNKGYTDPQARGEIARENPRLTSVFNAMKVEDMQREAEQQAAQQKAMDTTMAGRGYFRGPDGQYVQQFDPAEDAAQAERLKAEARVLGERDAQPPMPTIEQAGGANRGLEGTLMDELTRETQRQMSLGVPAPQAAVNARAVFDGKQKELDRQYKRVEESEANADEMLALADQMESALQRAGHTGMGGQIAQTGAGILGMVSGAQAEKYAAGKEVESFKAKAVALSRTKGVGAMSDPEMRMYLQSAPNLNNPAETNLAILDRWRYAASLEKGYAEFMREQRAQGTPVNEAEQAWREIVRANPYLVRDESGQLQPNPDWANALTGAGQAAQPEATQTAASGPIQVKTLADGSQVRVQQLPDGRWVEVE